MTLTLPALYTPASRGSHFGDLTPLRILKLMLTPWMVRTGLLLSWEFTWAQFPNLQRGFAFSDIMVHAAMSALRAQHHLDGILFLKESPSCLQGNRNPSPGAQGQCSSRAAKELATRDRSPRIKSPETL